MVDDGRRAGARSTAPTWWSRCRTCSTRSAAATPICCSRSPRTGCSCGASATTRSTRSCETGKANTHLKIRSPIDGHVTKKYVREGQYVEEGDAALRRGGPVHGLDRGPGLRGRHRLPAAAGAVPQAEPRKAARAARDGHDVGLPRASRSRARWLSSIRTWIRTRARSACASSWTILATSCGLARRRPVELLVPPKQLPQLAAAIGKGPADPAAAEALPSGGPSSTKAWCWPCRRGQSSTPASSRLVYRQNVARQVRRGPGRAGAEDGRTGRACRSSRCSRAWNRATRSSPPARSW